MSKGIGRQIQVGFAKETVRGTAEAAATFWLPFVEASVEEKIDQVYNDQSQGVIEETIEAKQVGKHAEISVKGNVGDKTFPLLLLSALGAISTGDNADADASVKDHTFSVGQSVQHQALTSFLNDPLAGADYTHALSCVDSLSLAYEARKFITFDIKMMAKTGVVVGAGLTPATTAENLFSADHFSLKLASAIAGLDGASAIAVKGFKLNINKALESDDVLGSLEPADFLNKSIAIDGEIEAVWQNEADFKTAFMAGTTKAMRIDLVNTGVTIGTAANPRIKIDLNKVTFTELTRPIKVGDVIRQTIGFKAHYSTTDAKMVSIVATNVQASY